MPCALIRANGYDRAFVFIRKTISAGLQLSIKSGGEQPQIHARIFVPRGKDVWISTVAGQGEMPLIEPSASPLTV